MPTIDKLRQQLTRAEKEVTDSQADMLAHITTRQSKAPGLERTRKRAEQRIKDARKHYQKSGPKKFKDRLPALGEAATDIALAKSDIADCTETLRKLRRQVTTATRRYERAIRTRDSLKRKLRRAERTAN